jgi:hypothetical protein
MVALQTVMSESMLVEGLVRMLGLVLGQERVPLEQLMLHQRLFRQQHPEHIFLFPWLSAQDLFLLVQYPLRV